MVTISHFCISSTSIIETVDFFSKTFDSVILFEYHRKGVHYGTFLKLGKNAFVEIFLAPRIDNDDFPLIRHVCLAVNSLNPYREKLVQHGFNWNEKIGAIDNTKQIMIDGPDGLKIELHQIDPDSLLFTHI